MELQPVIVALLAGIILGMLWLGWELRKLNTTLQPVLGSSIVQGLSAL